MVAKAKVAVPKVVIPKAVAVAKAVSGKKVPIMYCVKCKKKQECKHDLKVTQSSKGTPMIQGPCCVCSTKMTSFIKKENIAEYK